MAPPEQLLTSAQVAERLGIKRRQAQYLIQRGHLPAQRLGRDWLVRAEDLALVAVRRRGRPPRRPP